jgi:glycosyltransferase involved in cell wall biosynthesis
MDSQAMKSVLLVAYHFPPVGASSGYLRTLKFAKYLPEFGYVPTVLTVAPRAYPVINSNLPPDGLHVERAFALDTARHLSIGGRYPKWLASPDRWQTWIPFAVRAGKRLIKEIKPEIIFSTFPIASAHVAGLKIARQSGIPWVADFRDPMAEPDYPPDADDRQRLLRLESAIVSAAGCCVFTTQSTREMYESRYPHLEAKRVRLIPNGYDEDDFSGLDVSLDGKSGIGLIKILHSGTIYPSERDPTAVFEALGHLKDDGTVTASDFRLSLRATGHDGLVRELIAQARIEDLVEIAPPLPYRDALREMMESDALLLLQAGNCNRQVPAKIYEYFRSGRPIIALTDLAGETASVLRDAECPYLADLRNPAAIAGEIRRLITDIRSGSAWRARSDEAAKHSRRELTGQLATVFDDLANCTRT